MTTSFVQKGCQIIKQAVEKDNAENYEEAVSLYSQGIQYLMTGLKYEKNQKVKTAIKEKVQKYLKRAEDIQSKIPHNSSPKKPKITKTKITKIKNQKKMKVYPTQQDINEAMDDINQETIDVIYGYIHQIEISLNINHCIPNGIINLCLYYYHIQPSSSYVKWDDIAGLENVKTRLKEYIILPLKFPTLFTCKPQNNVLLYGPPGVGKSYLAQAVASDIDDGTFFHVSSSDLLSSSELMVKNLFNMAREENPSLIFFDEIDNLAQPRHHNTRCRIRTEFLVQMLGLKKGGVLTLGATNCPWDLDPAIRRRFNKRIYIPLPTKEDRTIMFKRHVGKTPNDLSEQDYIIMAEKTDGFSGSDINGVVQDAMMEPVTSMQTATHFVKQKDPNGKCPYIWLPCSPATPNAVQMSLMEIHETQQRYVRAGNLKLTHFLRILTDATPRVRQGVQRYIDWNIEFGQE